MSFNINTTVEVQIGTLGSNDTFLPRNNIGQITINGQLSGSVGREIQLTAPPDTAVGYINNQAQPAYQFKKWIIETIPITRQPVSASRQFNTYTEICSPRNIVTRTSSGTIEYYLELNTIPTTKYFYDGQFLYLTETGNTLAPAGFYGVGNGTYYSYNPSIGLSALLVCGQNAGGNNTGGGGSDETAPGAPRGDDVIGPGLGGVDPVVNPIQTVNQI